MAKLVSKASGVLSNELVGLPCGTCIGCRAADARGWAARCLLESYEHACTSFWTLTYRPECYPGETVKAHVSGFLKRYRARVAPKRVRFFASAERGDRFGRAHYHALLFGVRHDDQEVVAAWPYGYAYGTVATPERIAYCAGYTAQKLVDGKVDYVDGDTGEVLERDFRLMSRGGRKGVGIGGAARQRNPRAFIENVANGDGVQPAPLYLKRLFLDKAGRAELAALGRKKYREFQKLAKTGALARERLEAGELIAKSKRRLASSVL